MSLTFDVPSWHLNEPVWTLPELGEAKLCCLIASRPLEPCDAKLPCQECRFLPRSFRRLLPGFKLRLVENPDTKDFPGVLSPDAPIFRWAGKDDENKTTSVAHAATNGDDNINDIIKAFRERVALHTEAFQREWRAMLPRVRPSY